MKICVKIILAVIIAVIIVCLGALMINWLILTKTPNYWFFNKGIVGEGKDWLMFWATFLSAIASFAMVFITWYSLGQNKKQNDAILMQNKNQLEELKRQWDKENRPYLSVDIKVFVQSTDKKSNEVKYMLIVDNYGNHIATNVKIILNPEFLLGIKCEECKKSFVQLLEKTFYVKPKDSKVFILCDYFAGQKHQVMSESFYEYNNFLEYLRRSTIYMDIEYNNKYKEEISISMINVEWMNTSIVQALTHIQMSIDNLDKGNK